MDESSNPKSEFISNAETLEAMAEARNGDLIRFNSVDALMQDLSSD